MKQYRCFFLAMMIIVLTFCSCSSPWHKPPYGVYEGILENGHSICINSWYDGCDYVLITSSDGTEQQAFLSWGQSRFTISTWRDIHDEAYMSVLYSGKYYVNYPSCTKLVLNLDSGEKIVLTKIKDEPETLIASPIFPKAHFFVDHSKVYRHSAQEINQLKQNFSLQEMTYSQFIEEYVVEDMIYNQTHYIVRLIDEQDHFTYVFIDKESLIITDISDNETMKSYYTLDDFQSIVIGESTFQDVYDIAPSISLTTTSYGGFCEYPSADGKYIHIKFYGAEMIVGAIELTERSEN